MLRKRLLLMVAPLAICVLSGGCSSNGVETTPDDQAVDPNEEQSTVQTEPDTNNTVAGPITGTWSGTLTYQVISTVKSDDPKYPVDSSPQTQTQSVPWSIAFDNDSIPTAGLAVLGGYLTGFPSTTPLEMGQVGIVLKRPIETGTLQTETATVYEAVFGPVGAHVVLDLREWSEGGDYHFEYNGRQATDISVSGNSLNYSATCDFAGWVQALDGHLEHWEWIQELSGTLIRQ